MYRRHYGIGLWTWATAMLIVYLIHRPRLLLALAIIALLIAEAR